MPRGLTRRARIVPLLAMLVVLIPVVVYSVLGYSRVPEPSWYSFGYPPTATGFTDGPATVGELSKQPESGDRWVRKLLGSESPWTLGADDTRVGATVRLPSSSQSMRMARMGWPFELMSVVRQVPAVPTPPGTPWASRGPWLIGAELSWSRWRLAESTVTSVSLVRVLGVVGLVALAVRGYRVATRRWHFRRWVVRAAGVCALSGLVASITYTTSPLPIMYGSSAPTPLGMRMSDLQRMAGTADGDAKLADAAIRSGIDAGLRPDQVGLIAEPSRGMQMRTWRIGWPAPIVGTKSFSQAQPAENGLRVILGRNGEFTLWLPTSPTERHRMGRVVYFDALVALSCACWLAYLVAWWACHGFDRWRSRRWIRRGFCGGCGYDLR